VKDIWNIALYQNKQIRDMNVSVTRGIEASLNYLVDYIGTNTFMKLRNGHDEVGTKGERKVQK
jgi:hypothetical protein